MNINKHKQTYRTIIMSLNERQNAILQTLKEEKKANVRALAKTLFVSEATIRRDLKEMQQMGLVERRHGGAVLPEHAEEVSLFFRIGKNAREKERAASAALLHIPPFKTVFLDGSSTTLALAERMDLRNKTVITNCLQAALQLSKKTDVQVLLLGGTVRQNTTAVTGCLTVRLLGELSFDLMLCSCAAVRNGEALERSLEQAELKRTAFQRSQTRILLFDHTKTAAHGTYKVTELSAFDIVATDQVPNAPKENVRYVYPV